MTGVQTCALPILEVITGVPSAEYGDLNSGMVKIHTRKGKTPWNILLSINPRTEQVSFAKGLDGQMPLNHAKSFHAFHLLYLLPLYFQK